MPKPSRIFCCYHGRDEFTITLPKTRAEWRSWAIPQVVTCSNCLAMLEAQKMRYAGAKAP
jgi:hypothetical protein